MKFVDKAPLEGTKILSDTGFLVAEAFAVRTGIQEYLGSEVGLSDELAIVKVYRPEEEVRSPDSLVSFSHIPITIDHPAVDVDTNNWKDLAVGEVSTEAKWVDNKIALPLILKDKKSIDLVNSGVRELSAGYTCDLEFTPGVTDSGERYDAIQRNIRANHLAIVQRGRAGSECRIGDSGNWGAAPYTNQENKMTYKTLVLGDKAVNVAEEHAQDVQAHIDGLNKNLAARDAEIESLKSKVLDEAAVTAMVESRSNLIAKARLLNKDGDYANKSELDIKKTALSSIDGISSKDAAYVDAMFDIKTADLKEPTKGSQGGDQKTTSRDSVAAGLIDNGANVTRIGDADLQKARADRLKRMRDAYKQ